jgi:ATP-binding cassette subfamily F protein uup
MPATIEALEQEQRQLNEAMAAPEFYKEGSEKIKDVLARLGALEAEIHEAYARWHELESRAEEEGTRRG